MCDNHVTYYYPKGFDYIEVKAKCGNTNPYGGLALCEDCEHERTAREARTTYCKDMGFDMDSMASIKRNRAINYYEHKMLEEWFRETFSEQIKANQPGGSA